MADWKVVKSGYSEIGVEWNITNYDTYISYAPVVYLYYYVNSSDPYIEYSYNLTAGGSSVSNGSTTLSTGGAFKGSKQIDSFSTRTISRGTGTKSLSLNLSFGDLYGGYGSGWSGSWSGTWYYTVPALASYTVSYNANGGSGAPGSQTKYQGQTLYLSSTQPTRTGYNFKGWATSASGSVIYQPGNAYTANSSVTLYAIWELKTYTVSYNANGGTGAPNSQTKSYGIELTLSSTKPTKTGYVFKGWATSASGAVIYVAGGKYTANAAITLYAVWQKGTFTISYDANGGSGAPSNQTKTYSENLTLSTTIPVREGYNFIGWGLSASDIAASYAAGGAFTLEADTTLYAIWSLKVVCSISYDPNGGENPPQSQLYEKNTILYLSTEKPIRDNYYFSGWSLNNSAETAQYLIGNKYINNDFSNGDVVTLYAVWNRAYDILLNIPDGMSIADLCIKVPQGSGYDEYYV